MLKWIVGAEDGIRLVESDGFRTRVVGGVSAESEVLASAARWWDAGHQAGGFDDVRMCEAADAGALEAELLRVGRPWSIRLEAVSQWASSGGRLFSEEVLLLERTRHSPLWLLVTALLCGPEERALGWEVVRTAMRVWPVLGDLEEASDGEVYGVVRSEGVLALLWIREIARYLSTGSVESDQYGMEGYRVFHLGDMKYSASDERIRGYQAWASV